LLCYRLCVFGYEIMVYGFAMRDIKIEYGKLERDLVMEVLHELYLR